MWLRMDHLQYHVLWHLYPGIAPRVLIGVISSVVVTPQRRLVILESDMTL